MARCATPVATHSQRPSTFDSSTHLSVLVTFDCGVFSGWQYTPAGGYFTYERALSLQQGEPTFLAKESMKFLPSPNVQATIHEQLK